MLQTRSREKGLTLKIGYHHRHHHQLNSQHDSRSPPQDWSTVQSQILLTMVLEEEEEDVRHANQVIDCASRALELVMMVIRLHILRQGVRNRLFSLTKNWLQASCCIASL